MGSVSGRTEDSRSGRRLRLSALVVAVTVAAALAVPAIAPAATLYDQLDDQATGTGSGTPSYFYEDGTGDEQAADDFTVPAGQMWTITGAQAPGIGVPLSGDFGFRVTLFTDAAGKPGTQITQTQSTTPRADELYTLHVDGAPQLQPGHYWVSIQLMNLATWMWTNRTVQSGSPAMWQNPDGSDGKPECVTWNLRTTCESETSAFPDQAFSVLGDSAPLPVTPPTHNPKPKKCKKHKKKHKRSAESAKKKQCKKKKKKRR